MILDDVRQWLNQNLQVWARAQGLEALPDYSLEEPPPGIEADFACNLALVLAKPLRKSPRLLAQELQKALPVPSLLVESTSIAGAGFVNLKLKSTRWQEEIGTILATKELYGQQRDKHHQKF